MRICNQPTITIAIQGNSWKQLTTGQFYNCALSTTDQAYCWGYNRDGQLGNNDNNLPNSNVPVAVFQEDSVLKGEKLTKIKSGINTTCALTTENKLYCWGSNHSGMLGNKDYSDTVSYKPVLVNKPIEQTVPQRFINELDIIDFSVGSAHICALDTLKNVYCWGSSAYGELGLGSSNTQMKTNIVNAFIDHDVEKVATGDNYTCILASDKNIYCTGRNDVGQLGLGTTRWAAASPSYSAYAHITQIASGDYTDNVTDLEAKQASVCLVDGNNDVYCWGYNAKGQAGKHPSSEADSSRYSIILPATQYQAETRQYYTEYSMV